MVCSDNFEGENKYPLEFEKLLGFCDLCRLIGHVVTECGDGLDKPEDCEWSDWLVANFGNTNNTGPTGRGRSRGGGYAGHGGGFGQGRGNLDDRSLPQLESCQAYTLGHW